MSVKTITLIFDEDAVTSICMKMTIMLIGFFGRISPSEWAEPDTEDHSLTFSHSLWYLMGSLTLQGKVEHIFTLA